MRKLTTKKSNIIAVSALLTLSLGLMLTITSCSKTTEPVIEPTPGNAIGAWVSYYAYKFCTGGTGMCGATVVDSRDELLKAAIPIDGSKADCWATKDSNGNVIIKMNMFESNLSPEKRDMFLTQKKHVFDSTTQFDQSFVNSICKASGLKERPDAKNYFWPAGTYSIKFNRTVGVDEKFMIKYELRPHPAYPVPNGKESDEIVIY